MKPLWGGKLLVPERLFFVLYWVPAVCMGIVGIQWLLAQSIECTNSYTIHFWFELMVCLEICLSSPSVFMLSDELLEFRFGKFGTKIWKIWYLSVDRSRWYKDEWDMIWAPCLPLKHRQIWGEWLLDVQCLPLTKKQGWESRFGKGIEPTEGNSSTWGTWYLVERRLGGKPASAWRPEGHDER